MTKISGSVHFILSEDVYIERVNQLLALVYNSQLMTLI